jgi:hypothetical protein
MSKKKFSQGLDELFSDARHGSALAEGDADASAARERRAGHKNFAAGLDALLQEVLDESMEKFAANQPDSVSASGKTRSSAGDALRASMPSGLDALIRQTIDIQEVASDEQSGKKRLTVAVDRQKLEKLKLIARLENAYLKDLLVTLIDGYIEEYAQQKGLQI